MAIVFVNIYRAHTQIVSACANNHLVAFNIDRTTIVGSLPIPIRVNWLNFLIKFKKSIAVVQKNIYRTRPQGDAGAGARCTNYNPIIIYCHIDAKIVPVL